MTDCSVCVALPAFTVVMFYAQGVFVLHDRVIVYRSLLLLLRS